MHMRAVRGPSGDFASLLRDGCNIAPDGEPSAELHGFGRLLLLKVAGDAVRGLAYGHGNGILHGNVGPEHVLIRVLDGHELRRDTLWLEGKLASWGGAVNGVAFEGGGRILRGPTGVLSSTNSRRASELLTGLAASDAPLSSASDVAAWGITTLQLLRLRAMPVDKSIGVTECVPDYRPNALALALPLRAQWFG